MLFLFGLIGLSMTAIPFCLEPPGELHVILEEKVFNSELTGKTLMLKVFSSNQSSSAPISRNSSEYVAEFRRIKPGRNVAIEVEVKGYKANPLNTSIDILPLEKNRINISLIPTFGRLKISAANARKKNEFLSSFTVEETRTKLTASGDRQGVIFSDLEPGKYHIVVKSPDFCPGEKDVSAESGKIKEEIVPLSPAISGNELARIVLDWGPEPRDLDSHLFLPVNSSLKSNHVYFSSQEAKLKNGDKAAELDVDYRHSEGYETVTIYKKITGTYQYIVNRFAGEKSIGESEATVEIVTDGCEKKKFNAPRGCRKKDWHVFNLEYNGSTIRFTEVNECAEFPGKPIRKQ
jgi:hypothetical protein